MFIVFYLEDIILIFLVYDGVINKEIYFVGFLTSVIIEELQRGLYRIMLKACINVGLGFFIDLMEIFDINMLRKFY